jgi:pSer/pThr/pTyr-binding forkhead associated (FHA) protein
LVTRGRKVLTRATLGQRTLLGRSEHNDVCLPSPYLGRHHAVIVGTPQGYYVVDLNSVNGTSLNGRLVERAVLFDQDVLSIGPFRLKVQVSQRLAHGDPLPEADSLADTAVMPPREPHSPTIRRVK